MELSADFYQRLRATLQGCHSLLTDVHLQGMFIDDRLYPWRPRLPAANNVDDTIAALIGLLIDGVHAQTGRSALVLFLEVYSEQFHEKDNCRRRVANLARELEGSQPEQPPAVQEAGQTKPAKSWPTFTTIASGKGRIGQVLNIDQLQGSLNLGDVHFEEEGTRSDEDED